ncbi:hypothetical protein ACFQ0K_07555 [Nocardioides caeni]|uniref:DUF3558 domain-containing protein n=1 Tax=Nocardioides caeni TaxID=574700 RepID=A0A4S8N031_9ACTN|nr:hypothetical protein [Nocardioides caeni]THV09073.1 hypothetical protein E9934_17335 [Nocardioides caeni]
MTRAWIVGLLLVGAVAAGCGDDTDKINGKDSGDTSSTGSDGGDSGDSGDSGALPLFCDLITAEEIGEALGAPVTTTTGPFDVCEFDQEDPRALSGSLGTVEVGADNGGFESYRSGSSATLENATDHPLDDLGEAFVATGTFAGGENLQASGGVLVDGGVVYTVTLIQGEEMSEQELVTISAALLQLMLDAA